MLELANTSLSVFRGTTQNAYGDTTDVGILHLTGLPAALVETTDTVFNQAAQRRQTVRTVTCRVPTWADVTDDDTLMDERSGSYYLIDSIESQPTLGAPPDFLMLTLRARSGVTPATD